VADKRSVVNKLRRAQERMATLTLQPWYSSGCSGCGNMCTAHQVQRYLSWEFDYQDQLQVTFFLELELLACSEARRCVDAKAVARLLMLKLLWGPTLLCAHALQVPPPL
jgi:hypothetical protein